LEDSELPIPTLDREDLSFDKSCGMQLYALPRAFLFLDSAQLLAELKNQVPANMQQKLKIQFRLVREQLL
jgi:hypothetical protein